MSIGVVIVTHYRLGDEFVQSLVPNRYFGWLDIGVNATASLLTLAFIAFVMPGRAYRPTLRQPAGL